MPADTPDLSKAMKEGGVWITALRMLTVLFAGLRLIVLARVLQPVDFGIMGIALLFAGALEALSQTGLHQALIHREERLERFLDTAWTLLVVRGFLLFAILYCSAPLVSSFFEVQEATPVLQVYGLTFLFSGLSNIGIVYFLKNLNFKRQFAFQVCGLCTDVVVSIVLAFMLKNAWALVIGAVSGGFVTFLMSYVLHPHRPKLALNINSAREMFAYGRWLSMASVFVYIGMILDSIVVGRVLGSHALGIYRLANQITGMINNELKNVVIVVAFPVYSKLQYDNEKTRELFFKVLSFASFVIFPLSMTLILVAEDFTLIYLGIKWVPIVPVLQILTISAALRALFSTGTPLFLGIGKPKAELHCQVVRAIVLGACIYPSVFFFGTTGAAVSVVLSITVMGAYWYRCVNTAIGSSYSEYLLSTGIFILTTSFMAAILAIALHALDLASYDHRVAVPVSILLVVISGSFYLLSVALLQRRGWGMRGVVDLNSVFRPLLSKINRK